MARCVGGARICLRRPRIFIAHAPLILALFRGRSPLPRSKQSRRKSIESALPCRYSGWLSTHSGRFVLHITACLQNQFDYHVPQQEAGKTAEEKAKIEEQLRKREAELERQRKQRDALQRQMEEVGMIDMSAETYFIAMELHLTRSPHAPSIFSVDPKPLGCRWRQSFGQGARTGAAP